MICRVGEMGTMVVGWMNSSVGATLAAGVDVVEVEIRLHPASMIAKITMSKLNFESIYSSSEVRFICLDKSTPQVSMNIDAQER